MAKAERMAKYGGLSGKDKLLAVLADQGRMIAAAPRMAEALELVDKRMTSYVPLDLPDDVAGDSMYAAYFSSDDLAVIETALAILRGDGDESAPDGEQASYSPAIDPGKGMV